MRRGAAAWEAAQSSDDIWQRLSRVTFGLILAVALACALVLFKPQLERREELKRELVALSEDYKDIRAEADRQQEELDWLRTDLNYLEAVARDRLPGGGVAVSYTHLTLPTTGRV